MAASRMVGLAAACLCVLACTRSSTPEVTEGDVRMALEPILLDLPHQRSCALATDGEPRVILAVTGRSCLSCRNIGLLIRDLNTHSETKGRVLVVTPSTDTADVCRYLRIERAVAPVLPVDPEHFDPAFGDGLIFLREEGRMHYLGLLGTGDVVRTTDILGELQQGSSP